MVRKNYKVQDGCHNCRHKFEKFDYEDSNEYFCTFGAPQRPICGSVAMEEEFSLARGEADADLSKAKYKICSNRDPWTKAMRAWDKWSKNRKVDPAGICEHHDSQ